MKQPESPKKISSRRKTGSDPKQSEATHKIFTHFPKDINCEMCNRCKISNFRLAIRKAKRSCKMKRKLEGPTEQQLIM